MFILAAGPESEPEAAGATATEGAAAAEGAAARRGAAAAGAGVPDAPEDLTWRRLSRLTSVCLLGLWTGLFLVILIAYRPGGPWDALVAAAAFAPVLIAAIAVVWPPMPDPQGRDQWRSRAAIGWVGLIALLLVGSMLVLEIEILAAGGDQALLPSLEVTYALILAIAFLSVFAALGVTRGDPVPAWRGHGRLVHAFGIAVVMCVGAALLMGGAAVANDLALRERPQVPSRFGPTQTTATPIGCDQPVALGPGAAVDITASATIDNTDIGSASISGVRQGLDEAWTGSTELEFATARAGYTRVDDKAWLRIGAFGPSKSPVDPFGMAGSKGLTLDGPVVALLTATDPGIVAEDLGVELVEGARARHCRTAVDGPTVLDAFLPLRWLAGGQLLTATHPLTEWRGTLDWWVFADGQLGQSSVIINGYPGEAWPTSGIQGSMTAKLTALDRTVDHHVAPPP